MLRSSFSAVWPLHLQFDRRALLGKRRAAKPDGDKTRVLSCSASCITQMKTCRLVIVKDACRQGQIVFCNPPEKTCNRLWHTSPHTLSSIISSHLLPYLVCGEPFVDEAHFSEVLHPWCHPSQHIHQLHHTQLALVLLRLWEARLKMRKKERRTWRKRVSVHSMHLVIPKKATHLLLQYNVALTELNPFICRIKTNRPLIHIIINNAAVVHRAEGHNDCLQQLTASFSRKHSICAVNYVTFSLLL